jgi:plastocyanin
VKIRRWAIGVVAAAAILAVGLAGKSRIARAQEQPVAVTVQIDNFSFTPKEITVAKGTTVTWINHDDVPHTVVSAGGPFRSKALDTDESYSYTFKDEGNFNYFCSVHPVMTGKVIVK